MAFELPILIDSSKRAFASLATKQFFFVKLTSNGIELCAAATDVPWGVLQNTPAAGEAAEVMRLGITKVKTGGIIAVGALVGTDNAGKADSKTVATDSTEYVVGVADEVAANGDIITLGINCLNPHRAA